MKTENTNSFIRKSLYSALVFFGTIMVLSVGYATWNSTMGKVSVGSSLSASGWNALVDNIGDLDSRWSRNGSAIVYTGGNVGIGITNPKGPLHIKASASHFEVGSFLLQDNNNASVYALINANKNLWIGYNENSAGGFPQADYKTPMFIKSDGNVGIWTTNPQTTLDVNGSFRAISQPHIFGSPTNTTGVGLANSFAAYTSRGGMTWSGDRIIVPISGVYLITFATISPNNTGRFDANVLVNGTGIMTLLNEDNGTGHHQKSGSISVYLSAGNYIQFYNASWYNYTNTGFDAWRTASVTLLN